MVLPTGRGRYRTAVALLLLLILGCSDWVMLDAERRILHKVKRGDNLYAIGFLYGLDYRQIAQENGIRPPYTIFVGQTIAIIPPDYMQIEPQQRESTPAPKPSAAAPSTHEPSESAADTPYDYWAQNSTETPALIPTRIQTTSSITRTPIPATPIPATPPHPYGEATAPIPCSSGKHHKQGALQTPPPLKSSIRSRRLRRVVRLNRWARPILRLP